MTSPEPIRKIPPPTPPTENAMPLPQTPIACRPLLKMFDRSKIQHVTRIDESGEVHTYTLKTANRHDAAYQQHFHDILETVANVNRGMAIPVGPINDPNLVAQYAQAKELILKQKELPCAYRWNEVRALVEQYGGHLVTGAYGRINPYDQGTYSVQLLAHLDLDKPPVQQSTAQIATRMVRNATHIAFTQAVLKWSGTGIAFLETAHIICEDFERSAFLYNQFVEQWNSARFLQTLQTPVPETADLLQAIHAYDADQDPGLILSIARTMIDYLKRSAETRTYFSHGFTCTYPARVSGPRTGYDLRPEDMDDPVVNTVVDAISHLKIH